MPKRKHNTREPKRLRPDLVRVEQELRPKAEGLGPGRGFDQQPHIVTAYLRMLQQNRWLIGMCGIAGILAALLISFSMRAEYEATARMEVGLDNSNPLAAERLAPEGNQISMKLETQLSILQSEAIAKNVIDNLKLASRCSFSKATCTRPMLEFRQMDPKTRSDLLRAYHRGFHAELVPRTQILEVKFRSTDPRLAASVANEIVNVGVYQNFRQRLESVEKASTWLNGQLEEVKKQAQDAQAKFVGYQQQVGIVGTDDSHNIALNRVDELNRRLATVEADRILKEAQYRVAVSGNPELIAAVVPDSVIQTLRKQQAELRGQYAAVAAKYDDNYPRVMQLRSEQDDVQRAIDQEVQNIRSRIEQEYSAAQRSEQMLQATLDSLKREALRVDASAVQYALLQRDVQTNRDLYESLVRKLKDAGIDQGLRSNDLRLVDEAEVPTTAFSPKLPVNVALGLLCGLAAGIGIGFLRASFDDSIRTPDDVEAQCLLPALAVVPRLSMMKEGRGAIDALAPPSSGPVMLQQPESEAAEAYRTLRTTLLSLESAGPRTISFVSGRGREGKSTNAVNTALVLAQQGKRVLLVDADMRCPTVHTQLQLPPGVGLSECLSQNVAPVPVRLDDTSFYVLRAGERPQYISELLSSKRMRDLLAQWRREYDFVIIDTPPVLAFTDGVIIAGLTDATVLVVRSTKTNAQALRYVRQRLERANATICGVLLNDVRLESFDAAAFYDRRAYARYQQSITA